MSKWSCIADGAIIRYLISLTSSYREKLLNLYWYCWGGGFPQLSYYLVALCLKITAGRPRGAGNTVLQHVIWSLTKSISGCQPYQWSQHPTFVLTKEEPIQLFSYPQVIAYPTNNPTFKVCIIRREAVGVLRVLWGWKLFWTRERKYSLDEFLI